jgi:hypothetical protein
MWISDAPRAVGIQNNLVDQLDHGAVLFTNGGFRLFDFVGLT